MAGWFWFYSIGHSSSFLGNRNAISHTFGLEQQDVTSLVLCKSSKLYGKLKTAHLVRGAVKAKDGTSQRSKETEVASKMSLLKGGSLLLRGR